MLKDGKLSTIEKLEVSKDLSGGVRIRFGAAGFVMSPEDAIRYGTAILQAAGCNVDFASPAQRVLRPNGAHVI